MKPHILFVDDEHKVLVGLRRMLRAQHDEWEMSFAHDAREALERVSAYGVDVIVTDIYMPGMDGFELLKKIRGSAETQHVPVIVLTGSHDHNVKRRALELDAVDLLNKPAAPQDVIARVRNAIRLKQYQDQLKNQNNLLEKTVAERTRELNASRLDIIWRLANAGEHRDENTGNHVVRVGCYCREMGKALGLDSSWVEMLFLASPLHDIGKIGIPDHILLKPGPLDEDEWEIMKRHCEIGAEILRERPKVMQAYRVRYGIVPETGEDHCINPILRMASSIALTHHERWDGLGYPYGLIGEEIPLESRIVAVADVFDALCSDRPYKQALSENEAWQMLFAECGQHFDPRVCAAMEQCADEFSAIRQEFHDEPLAWAAVGSPL